MSPSVALLAHSTNPRGGVVHALELGNALTDLGHQATVHAPDPGGRGFFRDTRCTTAAVQARPVTGDLRALVETRIGDYVAYFTRPATPRFDIYHAQDGISGNALADLRERGVIPGYLYTVHHIDSFDDPAVDARQQRAIRQADRVLCVSRKWQEALAADYGITATIVGNGVDCRRFTPNPAPDDALWRDRLGLGAGSVFLSVGGIERRKNSARLLQAFTIVRRDYPDARLVIAGGASLLDHSAETQAFAAAIADNDLAIGGGRGGGNGGGSGGGSGGGAVIVTGPLPDDAMPGLYRLADALVFPSLNEGFGLAVLEAMACGTPAIVSAIPPFTEHLRPDDVLWVDPADAGSIADAMRRVLDPATAAGLGAAGRRRAKTFGWDACAHRHLAAYAEFLNPYRSSVPCPK